MFSPKLFRQSICVSTVLLLFVACGGDSGSSSGGMVGGGGDMGTPTPESRGGLEVLNPEVRACDLLIQQTDQEVEGISFSTNVTGVLRKRLPKFAVSFTAKTNASIVGSVGTLQMTQGNAVELQIVQVSCFDQTGTKIEGDALVSIVAEN